MSDTSSEVKPCPFCGQQPRLVDLAGWEILCGCGAEMCLHDDPSKDGVTAAWNRRFAPPEALPALDKAAEARALEAFTDHFLKNYPPDCILARPAWHAPKIFRAAFYAIKDSLQPQPSEQRSTASAKGAT